MNNKKKFKVLRSLNEEISYLNYIPVKNIVSTLYHNSNTCFSILYF